jgi:acetyltransferase
MRNDANGRDGGESRDNDMNIRTITALEITAALPAFVDLLIDAVDSGASVGYLPPLERGIAVEFWRGVLAEVEAGTRIVIAGYAGGVPVGVVHLALVTKPNAPHRAEVQKLLVHTRHRGQGMARRLVQAAEAEAMAKRRTLLVLDTKKGDAAEGLYEKIGYVRVGEIPGYVINENGEFDPTVVFYKALKPGKDLADLAGRVGLDDGFDHKAMRELRG